VDKNEQQRYDDERVYVRSVGSHNYNLGQELERLRSLPRVIKASDREWHSGPQVFHKNMMNPGHGLLQSLHCSIEELGPGGRSQKHGHQNSALLYVLEGEGYDIHDGVKYDWNAGDLVVVTPGCVHQHFNALKDRPARVLIIKGKPLFLFMGLWLQGFVEKAPKTPVPGWENFKPIDGSVWEKQQQQQRR
jgi:quercetin dioxygenase-like cupin family protein